MKMVATCSDSVNMFSCNCVAGFIGTRCQETDECYTDPCQNDGTCTDGVNMYTCDCASGYTGNTCETDINECDSNPCLNMVLACSDVVNGFTCSCTGRLHRG